MAIEKELLDRLLAGRDSQDLFAKDGLGDELKKALSERILSANLDDIWSATPARVDSVSPETSAGIRR